MAYVAKFGINFQSVIYPLATTWSKLHLKFAEWEYYFFLLFVGDVCFFWARLGVSFNSLSASALDNTRALDEGPILSGKDLLHKNSLSFFMPVPFF